MQVRDVDSQGGIARQVRDDVGRKDHVPQGARLDCDVRVVDSVSEGGRTRCLEEDPEERGIDDIVGDRRRTLGRVNGPLRVGEGGEGQRPGARGVELDPAPGDGRGRCGRFERDQLARGAIGGQLPADVQMDPRIGGDRDARINPQRHAGIDGDVPDHVPCRTRQVPTFIDREMAGLVARQDRTGRRCGREGGKDGDEEGPDEERRNDVRSAGRAEAREDHRIRGSGRDQTQSRRTSRFTSRYIRRRA